MKVKITHLLRELNVASNYELIERDVDSYVEKIHKNAKILLLQNNQELCGFIAYYDNSGSKMGYLSMLAVGEKFQSQGIGRELLECSIRMLKRKGFLSYKLEVKKKELNTINFYEKLGFIKIEENIKSQYMIKNL